MTPRWILIPLAALSGYRQGKSKNIELGLAYQLDNGARVGLKIAHLSNGDFYDRNPRERSPADLCVSPRLSHWLIDAV
ncbi:MAG: acyloxyacyl hydrolase [Acidithiobacillus sp.]|nr:acyloxyacyl hydrolase [Acidithiobacillus sp.]